MRLMPHVASSVSSGRPYRNRITVRSSTMPVSRGRGERRRQRREQIEVERARKVGAKEILHDVGRVGADHDELAVRHVDDAHRARR